MFKNVFGIRGRIRRKEYCLTVLITIAIIILLGIPVGLVDSQIGGADLPIFSTILSFFLGYIDLAQSIKRSHDLGHSGWWVFIPLYGFWLLFQKGQEGDNEYGADPKAEA